MSIGSFLGYYYSKDDPQQLHDIQVPIYTGSWTERRGKESLVSVALARHRESNPDPLGCEPLDRGCCLSLLFSLLFSLCLIPPSISTPPIAPTEGTKTFYHVNKHPNDPPACITRPSQFRDGGETKLDTTSRNETKLDTLRNGAKHKPQRNESWYRPQGNETEYCWLQWNETWHASRNEAQFNNNYNETKLDTTSDYGTKLHTNHNKRNWNQPQLNKIWHQYQ